MIWLIRIFAPVFLLMIIVALLILPLLITSNKVFFSVLALVYYPTLIYTMYRIFVHSRKSLKERVTKILVDNKGVHYYRVNGIPEEVLYTQIEKWNLTDVYDVSAAPRRKDYILAIRYGGNTIKVDFEKIDPGYIYIINTRSLRRRFIQGIARFRPDLKIDPFVYEAFSIDPVNFRFDWKKYWQIRLATIAVLAVGCIVLGLIMLGISKWLF